MPVYNERYIKAKVREFNGAIKTNLLGGEELTKNCNFLRAKRRCALHLYSLLILLWEQKKKNYPQVYLEECKYKIKKIKMSKFINTELESESELESDTALESKLKTDSE